MGVNSDRFTYILGTLSFTNEPLFRKPEMYPAPGASL